MDPIAEIKELLDIETIFDSGDLALKRVKPGEWKANCPFHLEKTPSFFISERKKVYYCFGCEAKGSLIDLYAYFKNMSFGNAIRELADRFDISLGQEDKHKNDLLLNLGRLHQGTLKAVRKSKLYTIFLEERNIPARLAYEAELGYWPIGDWWKATNNISLSDLQELGLAGYSKALLEMRMVFPIRDWQGDIISFAGREIQSLNKIENKYINGQDSVLYHKGKSFYGTPISRSRGKVVICEGYFDQIAIKELGYDALAICGTAFTKHHAAYLRDREEVILMFDNDPAGVNVRTEATKVLLAEGIPVRWGYIYEGKDPMDCWIADRDKLRRGIESAKDPFDYISAVLKSSISIEQKQRAWNVARDLAAFVRDPFEVAKAMEKINHVTKVAGLPAYIPATLKSKNPQPDRDVLEQAESALLYRALANNSLVLPSEWPIINPDYKRAYAKLLAKTDVTDIDTANSVSKLFNKYGFMANTNEDEIIVTLAKAWLTKAREKWGYEINDDLMDELEAALVDAEDFLIQDNRLATSFASSLLEKALLLWGAYLGVQSMPEKEEKTFFVKSEKDAAFLQKLVSNDDGVLETYLNTDLTTLEFLAISYEGENEELYFGLFKTLIKHKSHMAFTIIKKIKSEEHRSQAMAQAKRLLV